MGSAPTAVGPYDTPTRCTGGPSSGAVALAAKVLALFPGVENWGIYNCRNARVGSSLSEHAEGRALDAGVGTNRALGQKVAGWAVRVAPALGIQTVIWYDQIWTSTKPYWHFYGQANGRPYADATLGHRDHVHIGLNRSAAQSLSDSVLGPLTTSSKDTVQGFAGSVGGTVSNIGGDIVSAAVDPLLEQLQRLTIQGLAMAAGLVLVVAGGYRAVTGKSLARATGHAAMQAGEAVATGGESVAVQAAGKAATKKPSRAAGPDSSRSAR